MTAAEVQGLHLARSSVPVQAPHFTRNIGCNIRGGSARVERALIDGGKRKLRVHNLLQVRGVVVGDANGTSSPGIEDGQHGLPRTESALRFVVPGVECNKKAVREERGRTACCCCCTPRRCFGRLRRLQGAQPASARAMSRRSQGTAHAATARHHARCKNNTGLRFKNVAHLVELLQRVEVAEGKCWTHFAQHENLVARNTRVADGSADAVLILVPARDLSEMSLFCLLNLRRARTNSRSPAAAHPRPATTSAPAGTQWVSDT